MANGRFHIEPLQRRLLAGNNKVHVIAAAQTMIGDGQQRVRIRRKVDADDICFLIRNVINETGVLVRKAVVILPPYMRTQQVI